MMRRTMSVRPLVVMALEVEDRGLFAREGVEVLFTGVGKVNAAYRLARRLTERRGEAPSLVVNFGTAGSRRHPPGTLVACRRFIQRDMDVSGLGFQHGETPFEPVPRELEFSAHFRGLPEATCGTGDRFETGAGEHPYEVLDMEAYALAKVCWLEGVPFACAKFVSDGADSSAAVDWESQLDAAARSFVRAYHALVGG
jgi:adenosylhomocysteine nucleosidase